MHYEHKNRATDADLRFMLRLGALCEALSWPSITLRPKEPPSPIRIPHSPCAGFAISVGFVIELKLHFQLVNLYQPQPHLKRKLIAAFY